MEQLDEAAFKQFAIRREKDLQRIARGTQGEHQLSDVVNEAWLVAHDLANRKRIAADFLSRSFQDLLISHVYQHLIRYTEQNIRRALRLDHTAFDENDTPHPVMRTLVSDEGLHPLAILVEKESKSFQDAEVDRHSSQAAAYICLLRHFNNKMQFVADHLLISLSHAYRRCACARLWAIHQNPAPLTLIDEKFLPGPWRRFRIQRLPEHSALDFAEELPLLHYEPTQSRPTVS